MGANFKSDNVIFLYTPLGYYFYGKNELDILKYDGKSDVHVIKNFPIYILTFSHKTDANFILILIDIMICGFGLVLKYWKAY